MGYNNYKQDNRIGNNGSRGGNRPNSNDHKGNFNKVQQTITEDFYNPYSFVPISNHVFTLDKTETEMLNKIHDVPVENGFSGVLKIDFESMTPLCVRGADGNNTNVDGQYFIPGSSIKGMIRSVFEILSLSNIKNGIANKRYSMRDLINNAYELKKQPSQQQSGFLIQLNGKFYIQPCKSRQCKYSDIEKQEDIKGLKQARNISDKYKLLKDRIIEFNDGSCGTWFFSGFMNNKNHEFWFDIPNLSKDKFIPILEEQYDDFIFIHEKENENANWKFWKKKLKNYTSVDEIAKDGYYGIVPCFFRTMDNGHSVRDLGFSFLYRQPYKNKIHDMLPEVCETEGIDLVQSLFGYVKGNKALKGRVMFGNSLITNPKFASEQTFILGSPKPTYYPFYLEQKNKGKLDTYFSENAIISGSKRYLVHQKAVVGNVVKSNVTSSFRPLEAGTKFSTNVYFHNLRDYELGALLAAITFCNKQNECFHSLGYCKPFGFGKIRVNEINILSSDNNIDFTLLNKKFLDVICNRCKISTAEWQKSVEKLFLISSGKFDLNKSIRYPNMQGKEFNSIKKQKISLTNFSPK